MTFQYNLLRPILISLQFFTLSIFMIGCGQGRGFALPAGEIAAGETAFTKFNCNTCHSTAKVSFKGMDENVHIPLGGTVTTLKSYGELVTSVINPSHRIDNTYEQAKGIDGTSKMQIFNEVMTVQELVDIVTYLQSEYEIETPSEFYYPY